MAIVLLGVGQLVLPPLADQVLRDRFARDGRVISVHVSAVPAIELLFGDADSATVHLADYTLPQSRVAAEIGRSSGVGTLHLRIDRLSSGLLTLHGVTVTKADGVYTATGSLSEADLRAAVPLLQSVTPLPAAGSPGLALRGRAEVPFIGPVTADVQVAAVGGRVVLSGAGLLDGFLHLTVFANPRVDVLAVGGGPAPGGIAVSARWRLR